VLRTSAIPFTKLHQIHGAKTMFPPKVKQYLMEGLTATPIVISKMLQDSNAVDFDRRPDPTRFTLREVLAHLADWEGVWLERMERMSTENNPALQGYDEGQWAIDHDYAHLDPHDQLKKFAVGRVRIVEFLRELSEEGWEKTGLHSEWKVITVGALAALVLGHDGYHTKQIAEWLTPEL
jgi:uncharacterized damage-inducible protein DinB